MVRLPVVAENWLDGDELSGQQTAAPPDSGGSNTGPKNPIGPVQGYPEDGEHAWRAANDDVITAAVAKYNSDNRYYPGDAAYMTPQLMKAWMMQESGGSRDAFKTDPFQVNKARDWPNTGPDKVRFAGLSYGQAMTPQSSADAALKRLQCRGHIDTSKSSAHRGKWVPYQGHYEALRNYNAAPLNGLPEGVDYANTVLNNAWASYGDWQK